MNSENQNPHTSVLLDETLDFLKIEAGGTFVDATLGAGGHAEAILQRNDHTKVVGFDQDEDAVLLSTRRLGKFGERIQFVRSNFSEIGARLAELGIDSVDGVIADLGVSSMQLDNAERGFSFRFDAPLDMRMDPAPEVETAAELLQRLSEEEIANVIFELGEERFSRRIARRIVAARKSGNPIETTFQLADIVRRSVPRKKNERVHPATKTFQALRIKVNRELEVLEEFLSDSADILKTGGTIVVLTFHSLEDRIVKNTFRRLSGMCFCPKRLPICTCGATKKLEILTRKPVIPDSSEQETNPRSRSAKLRAARRLEKEQKI